MIAMIESTSSVKMYNVYLSSPPKGLKKEFDDLFTSKAIEFLVDLVTEFNDEVDQLYYERNIKKYELKRSPKIPKFLITDASKTEWKIAPVGELNHV